MNQTDPELAGWAFHFPVREWKEPAWQEKYSARWLRWLEEWNPPDEWMQ